MRPRLHSHPMFRVPALGALVAPLLVLAGCGGGGSGSGNWQVLQSVKIPKDQAAYVHTSVGRPADVEIKVEASPNVKTSTSYSFACDANNAAHSINGKGPGGQTPVTGQLPVPLGPPGVCRLNVLATKSKPAAITITVLTRPSTTQQ